MVLRVFCVGCFCALFYAVVCYPIVKRHTVDTFVGLAACVAFGIHTHLYVGAFFMWVAIQFSIHGHKTESEKLIALLKATAKKKGL